MDKKYWRFIRITSYNVCYTKLLRGVWGARGVQRVLNQFFEADLKMDGIIGRMTLAAIANCQPNELFWEIKKARIRYYHKIAKKGKNHLFLEGWLKRINKIEYLIE